MRGLRENMHVFCPAAFVFIVVCHVVSGCGPSGGPPGSDGTYGKAPPGDIPDGGEILRADLDISRASGIARRAIQDYQERPTPKVIFTVFDEDKDGNIDACEWMEGGMTSNVREFVRILDEVDKNEDNVLSVEEFEAIHVRWKYGEMEGGASTEKEN